MRVVRVVAERVFLLLFRITRFAFLLQGLALCAAFLATTLNRSQDAPPWVELALRSSLFVSATLFVAGILLAFARRALEVETRASGDVVRPGRPWPLLLGFSLVALPVLAYTSVGGLVSLWREVAQLLDSVGFWEAMGRGADPFAGIVLLPILVALFVPSLETAAALFLVAAPPLLLVLLVTRSRRFPEIFAMLIVCQLGLVVSGMIASDAFSRVATEAIAAMTAADDPEVHRVAEVLSGAREILVSTARALVAPMLAYFAWLPFLLRARSVGEFFTAGDAAAPVRPRLASSIVPVAARPGPSAATSLPTRERSPDVPTTRTRGRRVGLALLALGSFMLAFSAMEMLRPRAHYVSSDPAPGASLASSPAIARVAFDGELDPSSALSVTRMATGSDAGNGAPIVSRSGGLDASDSARRTLTTELSGLPDGVYHAAWSSVPASGGVVRHGSFYFGVGVVGSDFVGDGELVEERDSGERRRRHTFTGGVLLLLFGAASLFTRGTVTVGRVPGSALGD